jgi:hypothetical protein
MIESMLGEVEVAAFADDADIEERGGGGGGGGRGGSGAAWMRRIVHESQHRSQRKESIV